MATNTAGTVARNFNKQMVHYLRCAIAYTDNGTVKTVGVIPAGSIIVNLVSGVYVNTAFNAGSTNTLDIGTSATASLYATDLALGTKAFVALDEAATQTGVNAWIVAADTTITCSVKLSGTAATAGAGVVVVQYIPNNDK